MRETTMRSLAALGAAVLWTTLALQLVLILDLIRSQGGTYGDGLWRYFGFFTILSNIFAAAVVSHAALRPGVRTGLGSARIELAMTAAMTMVGITYSLLLRHTWNPQGAQALADTMLHDVAPLICILFWLLRPHGALRWRDAIFCLIWPLFYCAYALVRGAFDGWYAYYFLDASALSTAEMARNIAGLSMAFLATGLALVGIDKALGRARHARQH